MNAALLILALATAAPAPAQGAAAQLDVSDTATTSQRRPSDPQHTPLDAPDSLRAGGLLFLHHPRQARLARELGEAMLGSRPLPGLPAEVQPRQARPPIRIWLAPDESTFVRLAGGAPPEWGAGIARSDPELVILPVYATERIQPADLPRVLRHELGHIALQRTLRGLRVPRWFHEGYARWVAGELNPEGALRIRLAFALGSAPPLDSLSLSWPSAEVDAQLAYLLATSAIQYLMEEAGEEGLRLMIERWRQGGDMDDAMRATYGVTLAQFEEDWRGFVKRRYGWAAALGHATLFWAIMSILLVLLVARRRKRDRAKLATLRATEPPDQPAFWEEPLHPEPLHPPPSPDAPPHQPDPRHEPPGG